MNHWIVRHKKLTMFLYTTITSILLLYLYNMVNEIFFDINFGWWIGSVIFLFVISWLFTFSCDRKEFIKGALYLNVECDPNKYLLFVEEHLKLQHYKYINQSLLFDKAICLKELGQFEASYNLLKEINIDKYPSMPIPIKISYYINLCDANIIRKNYEESKMWLDKAFQMIIDLKNIKIKTEFLRIHKINEIEINIAKGNFDNAEEFYLDAIKNAKDKLEVVRMNFSLGELYLLLSRTNEARTCFEFVIENGNQLYCAHKAKLHLGDFK